MASSTTKKTRLEKIQKMFRDSVESGRFYEASQMTRTLYFRYKSQKKFEEAEELLYESALAFLRHEQHESGFELARLLITLYTESKKTISDTSLGKIIHIIELSTKSSESRKDFIKEALSWTVQDYKHGHPSLHAKIAQKYWQEKDYYSARQHIIFTTDGTQCAAFLIEYHIVVGFPGEIDLFVTQAVLQFLCLRNSLTAYSMFFAYTSNHPGIQRQCQPYKQPLLNFIAFLLLIVEKGNIEQYTILCERYQPSIHRDPSYTQYLDKIGQLFFGLPPPEKNKSGIEGMLGNLMESLFHVEPAEESMVTHTEEVD